MSRSVTIRERATTCVDLFSQAVLTVSQTESSDDQNGLLDEFGRFKLWVSNIGVFADLHSSLDYRLRDFNDIKGSFTRQLITIESRLQQLHDAAQQDLSKTSITEDEDEEPGISIPTKSITAATFQDWNNTQLLQSIHQSTDWLHRLSNLVRKASFANQHKRADKFILKDEDDNDMSDTLTDYYTKLIKREFGGMQETLVQRLAASMLMRRRRIMYRRSQQQRWKIPQVEPKTKNLELATPSTKSVSTSLEPTVPLKSEKVLVLKHEGITTAPSRLTATTIDTNIRRRVSAPSGISKGSTAPLNEQSQLLIPPPPKGVKLGEDFVCDYCCLILPSKIALSRNAWADHVSKDLYPYVCVVDKCDDPIEIYSSRKEWLAHMSTRHLMRWYCIAKPHIQPLEFDSENGFIEHMRIDHLGKFKNDQLSLVAENSSRPKDSVFDDCPFCIGTSDNLEEHVGLHLRDLALRSLPWPDDDDRYSQLGDYLHSDNSTSNENTRSTIVDFISKSAKSHTIEITYGDDEFESNAGERLDSYGHFQEMVDQHKPMNLREQLSDKTLIRLAIDKYQGFPQLPTLVNELEALLDEEHPQAGDIAAIEEGIITRQQLLDGTLLDHEPQEEPTIRAMADPDETVPSGGTQTPHKVFEIAIICTLLTEYDTIYDIEIQLGDVVISRRVVEYIFDGTDKFILKDTLGIYDRDIADAAIRALYGSSELRSGEESLQSETRRFLYGLQRKDKANGERSDEAKTKYQWPGTAKDRLFEANYLHKHRITANDCNVCNGNPDAICDNVLHCSVCNGAPDAVCDDAREASCREIGCDGWEPVVRKSHEEYEAPTIHFEAIASGSIIVMNGLERDKISNGQGVIAFDRDGFGAWEKVPCIFIKSICDYADGHKDESWQNFAAATAAAATKAFLSKYGNHHKLD
ncbi:hypothetical protein J3E69DRAFT_380963 [Trichoderma sp. SZMC 28015]